MTPAPQPYSVLEIQCNGENRYLRGGGGIPLQSFADNKNRYSGSIFLLASGASGAAFPVARYANIPFIAMNGSILRLVDEKIAPLYYVCNDQGFVAARPQIAVLGCSFAQNTAMSLECLQTVYEHEPSLLAGKSLYLLERVNRYYGKKNLSHRHFA
jgi:KDO transferase-3